MEFLVAYDGSDVSKAALSLAATYAEFFKAKVLVVTSMEGGSAEKVEAIEKTEKGLAFAKQFLKDNGIDGETRQLVRGMSPGEDIVRYAEENHIDQIFVGVQKKSKTQKILLGSTAQYIILKAPCPVITVK
jgi:nucleotide-binding universal stress UspA family protein